MISFENIKVGGGTLTADVVGDHEGTHFVSYGYPDTVVAAEVQVRGDDIPGLEMGDIDGAQAALADGVQENPPGSGRYDIKEGFGLAFVHNSLEGRRTGGSTHFLGPITMLELVPPTPALVADQV